MKRYFVQKDLNKRSHYVLTQPSRLSDINIDDLLDDGGYSWHEKARRLQARRWRKIKHQVA